MGGLSGVTKEWNRQAMAEQTCPLALGATVAQDVGDPCLKFSLSDSSLFTHCLVSHLLCVRQRMGNMAIPALRSLIAHCSHHRMGISTSLQV